MPYLDRRSPETGPLVSKTVALPRINTGALPMEGAPVEFQQMRYAEITDFPRPHNRDLFPVVVHIDIHAEEWSEFQSNIADQTQAQVLGHDEGPNDLLTAHVGCTSDVVARRLTDRWSA